MWEVGREKIRMRASRFTSAIRHPTFPHPPVRPLPTPAQPWRPPDRPGTAPMGPGNPPQRPCRSPEGLDTPPGLW